MAAVLSCGPDAVLSHRSAAALWGLRSTSRADIDVTAPGRSRRGRAGITLHLVRRLEPGDRERHGGIPVTSVARTLLDLAEVVRPRARARAFEEAERLRLLDLRAVGRLLERSNGRRGVGRLRRLAREYRDEPAPTRSDFERDFLDLCREHGLPRPTSNVQLGEYEIDMLWSRQRLAVELDSRGFHQTRAAFERDRLRDADLQLAGYRVVRITHRRFTREPAAVAEMLRRMLS
jgi:very-short-patch-repair endonuclease